MRKSVLTLAIASAFAVPTLATAQTAPAAAPASPHTVTGNVSLVSDYRFRGISQTFNLPAIQGGFDYAHSSGIYAGTWASNVYGGTNGSGLGVNYFNGGMEWDFYGGYKFEAMKDITLDIGVLEYYYPGAKYGVPTKDKYNNTEVYIGAAWKWLTFKYSYSLTDYFGIKGNTVGTGAVPVTGACGIDGNGVPTTTCATSNAGSKGSQYFDLGATYELGSGFNLVGHIGRVKVKSYSLFNYTDYKLGVTKDWGGLTWGLAWIGTNAKKDVYRTAKMEGGLPPTSLSVKNTSSDTIVLSVAKTF